MSLVHSSPQQCMRSCCGVNFDPCQCNTGCCSLADGSRQCSAIRSQMACSPRREAAGSCRNCQAREGTQKATSCQIPSSSCRLWKYVSTPTSPASPEKQGQPMRVCQCMCTTLLLWSMTCCICVNTNLSSTPVRWPHALNGACAKYTTKL